MTVPKYHIVLFGATSFVGKIVAQYLMNEYKFDDEIKWAAAGRSKEKLEALKKELGPKAAKLELIVVDAQDEGALFEICQTTQVMVSTVGPYALYGETLVKVCAESGTDYCDLTGEVQWVRKMITQYEQKAQASGARIVHCCGFDSIPSDLGVFYLQAQAKVHLGSYCRRVKMRVHRMKGEFSGGTVASLMNVVKEASGDPDLRKVLANPYSLCPQDPPFSARQQIINSPRNDPDFKSWVAPFVMAAVNTRIVHRSHALAGAAWGDEFLYDEGVTTGPGVAGLIKAGAITAAISGLMAASAIKPSRWVLERFVVPKPGEGPGETSQAKGFFDMRFFGATDGGQSIRVKVTGDRDPGYGSTAKMLGEAALCLAQDIPASEKSGGFWTPSTLLGQALLERLQARAGLSFSLL